jgi:hypothetical protein
MQRDYSKLSSDSEAAGGVGTSGPPPLPPVPAHAPVGVSIQMSPLVTAQPPGAETGATSVISRGFGGTTRDAATGAAAPHATEEGSQSHSAAKHTPGE